MKHTSFRIAVAAMALVACARGDDYALAYHGKLVRADGGAISTKVPMTMEFRLFLSEEPDGSAPLWGRSAAVRFDSAGLFYTELRDSAGAALSGALHKSLSDAIAAAGGSNVWISVTPFGYGELLPRKRLGGVHRAERAVTANVAAKAVSPSIKAQELAVGELKVGGNFSVTKPLAAGSVSIENVVDPGAGTSIGASGGKVLLSPSFNYWKTESFSPARTDNQGVASADMLLACKDNTLGVFSMPMQQGVNSWPGAVFRAFAFIFE